jgi:hypothetical protein
MLPWRDTLPEHRDDRLRIWFGARWDPQGCSGELPTPFWTFNWLRQASRDEIELTVEIDQTYPLDQWPKRSITPSNTNAREGSTRNRLAHVDARGLRTPRPAQK